MAQPPDHNATASATVPFGLRMLLLNLEPEFTLGGVILTLFKPETYTEQMTRAVMATVDPDSHFIYTQLAGGWLHFAFTEAVILRLVDHLRVWRLLCLGMLMSDVLYCHSVAQAVGGWAAWVRVGEWTAQEWLASAMTWPFVLARLAIVLRLGMKTVPPEDEKAKL